MEGQTLVIPNKVTNVHNSASTYQVFNPNELVGDNSPTTPKPPKPGHHGGGCGILGEIFLVIVAVVVSVVTAGAALAALGAVSTIGEGIGAVLGVAGATTIGVGDAIVAGAIGGAVGSVVSQGVGVATGIQSKFDWGAVGLAAIAGGVGGGLGAAKAFSGLGEFGGAVARGVAGNVISQGIGVATGLQSKFDWAGVAAAGVSAGVMQLASDLLPGAAVAPQIGANGNPVPGTGSPASFYNTAVSGMAGAIAGAGARSLITGTDFGDNLMAVLPSAIGQTIGNAIAGAVLDPGPAATDTPQPGQGGGQVGTSQSPTDASLGFVPGVSTDLTGNVQFAALKVAMPGDGIEQVVVTPSVLDSQGGIQQVYVTPDVRTVERVFVTASRIQNNPSLSYTPLDQFSFGNADLKREMSPVAALTPYRTPVESNMLNPSGPDNTLKAKASGFLGKIAKFLTDPEVTDELKRQGDILTRAGDYVTLGGTGLAVAGVVTGQPEVLLPGIAGMAVGDAMIVMGSAVKVLGDILSNDRNSAVEDAVSAGVNSVMPPTTDSKPIVHQTTKYYGF